MNADLSDAKIVKQMQPGHAVGSILSASVVARFSANLGKPTFHIR
jgi:hypothetical protein